MLDLQHWQVADKKLPTSGLQIKFYRVPHEPAEDHLCLP